MIWNLPPRARTLPPCLAMIAGTRSVYFLYSAGSLIFERATQEAGMRIPPLASLRRARRASANDRVEGLHGRERRATPASQRHCANRPRSLSPGVAGL